ncbi:AraC family transcriptional regulator [Mucilaginibacter psychrotolerans]|uniref:AraC family transcriptional regulator n=1 Tax=Mucilaginibacter psychrotolerans TaxID=1524096 RepID=A0A4Y8SK74_9SPHI|nr:helix-turn-helix domain-containing protein [Mucilaginibacter psychrotolerans]TFF38907.1 AraC family transcriptional regulator [Mucilaginibacter psychrotolerans]
MKPQLLKLSQNAIHSFSARRDTMPNVNSRWHYHTEVELVYFKNGDGTQFVGDNISSFSSGDVVLLGANLPHYWKFDDKYFNKEQPAAADISVVHFDQNFWGEAFMSLPENIGIRTIIELAQRGIKITGANQQAIGELVEKILSADGARKIILLMEALLAIGDCKDVVQLASLGFSHNFQEPEKDRIHDIYNYSIANFRKKISLEEIAAIANISPKSFCKYFKLRSRKTYSRFINEIRIGHACKLLIEDKLHVKEICYQSGFYNFASFHKYFKQITGKSPLTYQKTFKNY